ncbi:MAG: hypothetical protein ACTHW5_01610 [Microbacterium sp.]
MHRLAKTSAALIGVVLLTLGVSLPAHAVTNVTSGHIDLVNIICPTGSGNLQLTTQLNSGSPIPAADMDDYVFLYDEDSDYVTWVPTPGGTYAGYWEVSRAFATSADTPWVGYNYSSGCSGSGSVYLSFADTSDTREVQLIDQYNTVQTTNPFTGSYPISPGDHEHFEWRFYANSSALPAEYELSFAFSGSSLITQNYLTTTFKIVD